MCKVTGNQQPFICLQLHEKTEALQRALDDMEKMKKLTRTLIDNSESGGVSEQCVGNVRLEDDQGYFSTYSHFGIHHEMLSDSVRTEAYRDAILRNTALLTNKEVLDLGCGTAILSMLCARAGARVVWAVDQSDIVYRAMDIVRENGLQEVVRPVRARLEDGELPFERVDVLVSEWMGYFLLFEGMLDSVVTARDRHLRPTGVMLPNRCTISVVGSGDVRAHEEQVGFWRDVYGFSMSCMVDEVILIVFIV